MHNVIGAYCRADALQVLWPVVSFIIIIIITIIIIIIILFI